MKKETFAISALLSLAALCARPLAAAPVSLDLGAGYSRSSAPAMVSHSDTLNLDQKMVGEEFSGFHLSLTLGFPLHRWFTLQATVSGAFESGEVLHPPTAWLGTPFLIVPGIITDASRRTYSYLGGIRVQDHQSAGKVAPWAYAMAGFATQTVEIEENATAEILFYPDGPATQSGLALSLGLGVDLRILRMLGLRLGVEYQPIFLGDEKVLSEGEERRILDQDYVSAQDVSFLGETIHDVRFIVAPMLSF